MTDFIRIFKQRGKYSLQGMRETACYLLPNGKSRRDALYEDLNRGRDVLEDEDLLNMYLYSFGKMHKFKLLKTFICVLEQMDFNREEIEIYDWGCGQGLATICFLDCVNYCEISPIIRRINLIDPSYNAINRASEVIKCIRPDVDIQIVNKYFDNLNEKDFTDHNVKKIHLFSNILDVESYDISRLARLINQLFSGDNLFICVGPCYNRDRIDIFEHYIEPDNTLFVFDRGRDEWVNDWSISIRVFSYSVPYRNPIDEEQKNTTLPIVLNKANFGDCEFGLSALKEAKSGSKFYWVLIYPQKGDVLYCATSESFTKLLGDSANDDKLVEVIAAHQDEFEVAPIIDEETNMEATFKDGTVIYAILKRTHTNISPLLCNCWIDNYGAKYSNDWATLLKGPDTETVKTMIINSDNYHKEDLWVSEPHVSEKGKTTYWCSLKGFEEGRLMYLSSSVWSGLEEVNKHTVWEVISNGDYIIREAISRETGEWLIDEDNKPIMMISKMQCYLQCDWKTGKAYLYFKELNDTDKYTIKSGTKVIADYAFSDCKLLETVTFPDSVEKVGRDIFKCCDSLKTIIIPYGTYNYFCHLLPDYKNLIVEQENLMEEKVDDLPF